MIPQVLSDAGSFLPYVYDAHNQRKMSQFIRAPFTEKISRAPVSGVFLDAAAIARRKVLTIRFVCFRLT
jgi:hypothetical protein